MAAPIAHGGGLIAARRRYPKAPEPWIDLSTGINPVPYPVPPMPPEVLNRLPEPEAVAALEAAAAAAYGVADPACVVAAPGTQALIHLLPRLLPPRRVKVLAPTYAEHAAAWMLAGHKVTVMPRLDLGIQAVPQGQATPGGRTAMPDRGSDVLVLVRPNNPDGAMPDAAAILAYPGLTVVDEAFADLEGCSLAHVIPRPGLMILRSFGKTYGLAGLRLGFALAEPALASTIRDALGPWAVSGPAVHAGLHALPDAAWRTAAADRLASDAARLDAMLSAAGCRTPGGTRLFRLVRHDDAAGLAGRLARVGILVRLFHGRPGLLRFGIPAPADWPRLETALGISGNPASAP